MCNVNVNLQKPTNLCYVRYIFRVFSMDIYAEEFEAMFNLSEW